MSTCQAVQYSDQMSCGRCGLQWDVGDPDRPACAQVERRVTVRAEARPLREQLPVILRALHIGATTVEQAAEQILAAVTQAPPAAWVDDMGKVKFALGVTAWPGMKLFTAAHQIELLAGDKRVHLAAADNDLSRVYVGVAEGAKPVGLIKFVRDVGPA